MGSILDKWKERLAQDETRIDSEIREGKFDNEDYGLAYKLERERIKKNDEEMKARRDAYLKEHPIETEEKPEAKKETEAATESAEKKGIVFREFPVETTVKRAYCKNCGMEIRTSEIPFIAQYEGDHYDYVCPRCKARHELRRPYPYFVHYSDGKEI